MVKSPNKVITSGTAPTTTNTSKGDLAFGTVNGEIKLYGNTGTEVVELGGGGGSEVNSIAPLKVNTAPTTDADTVANVAVGEQATATIGDLSGLSEHNRTGMEALIAEMGGACNTSIGAHATATGFSCTAIGYGAAAGSNLYDNTVGGDPLRGGYVSIALGPAAIASETGSIAIGSATESKSPLAIAIGHTAKAKADDVNNGPVAIGLKASATGASSVAIGANSKATEANEFSVGFSDGDTSLTRRITHVTDPTDDQDAATKKYVDDKYTTLETTVAGKADTSTLANYATKTELAAKADQTAVDAKVSSVTAGTGVTITGSATAPVVNGMIAIPDYDNGQYVYPALAADNFIAPSNGVIYRAAITNLAAGAVAMLNIKVNHSSSTTTLSTATNYSDANGATSITGVYPIQKGTLAWLDRSNSQSDISGYFYFAPYKLVEIS